MINKTSFVLVSLVFASSSLAQESRADPMAKIVSELRPRVYDVRDLIAKPREDETGPNPPMNEDPLIRAARAFIPPPIDEHSFTAVGGQIIANLTIGQHAWLLEFLVARRSAVPAVFRVETQFVVASLDQAKEIGIENGLPVYVSDDVALSVVREEIAAMKGAFVGPVESTEILSGRPGREELFGDLTYVKAYERRANVEPGNRTLVVPVLATAREGSFLDVLAVTLPGDRIGCILKATLARIEKPVPVRETPDGPLAVPVVTTMSIEAKASFDGKMTILFPGPARDGRIPFVLTKVSLKPSKGAQGR